MPTLTLELDLTEQEYAQFQEAAGAEELGLTEAAKRAILEWTDQIIGADDDDDDDA